MRYTNTYLAGVACIVVGFGFLIYALAGVVMRLISVIVGYKLVDFGLRLCGHPPIAYWISWIRAQWRI